MLRKITGYCSPFPETPSIIHADGLSGRAPWDGLSTCNRREYCDLISFSKENHIRIG
jgi:hypothetical protein